MRIDVSGHRPATSAHNARCSLTRIVTVDENEAMWQAFLAEGKGEKGRAVLRALPSEPRCMMCHSPFEGLGGHLMPLLGRGRSREDPRFCNACIVYGRDHPGGAHVDLAMVFADVRGSTPLAERLGDQVFSDLINRFFRISAKALVRRGALLGRLAGDEAIGFFVPGIAGGEYAKSALDSAQDLLLATGHADDEGPWIPVGAGVHAGRSYVGLVGAPDGAMELTALGDDINVGARIAEAAGTGELLASLQLCRLAGVEVDDLEHRDLSLKGKEDTLEVVVIPTS